MQSISQHLFYLYPLLPLLPCHSILSIDLKGFFLCIYLRVNDNNLLTFFCKHLPFDYTLHDLHLSASPLVSCSNQLIMQSKNYALSSFTVKTPLHYLTRSISDIVAAHAYYQIFNTYGNAYNDFCSIVCLYLSMWRAEVGWSDISKQHRVGRIPKIARNK